MLIDEARAEVRRRFSTWLAPHLSGRPNPTWLTAPRVRLRIAERAARGTSTGNWIADAFLDEELPVGQRWLYLGSDRLEEVVFAESEGLFSGLDLVVPEPMRQRWEGATASGRARFLADPTRAPDPSDPPDPPDLPERVLADDGEPAYDGILCDDVLAHRADLDDLLGSLCARLRPGGTLIANEYLGPAHHQHSDRSLEIVEDLLAGLPRELRIDPHDGEIKSTVSRLPSAHWRRRSDGAVSSERVEEALAARLELRSRRPYGGTLLAPLLDGIAGNFAPENEHHGAFLELLLTFEEHLLDGGGLESDHGILVLRKGGGETRRDG